MSTHIFEYIGDSKRFGYGMYLDLRIIIDSETNYINATKLCALGNKKLFNWHKTDSSKELIACYNESIMSPSDQKGIQYEISGGDLKGLTRKEQEIIMGTYYHKNIIVHIAQWISPTFALKTTKAIDNYEQTLRLNIPELNCGLPSFITDKNQVNTSLNALNALIGYQERIITALPKAKIESYEEILSRKVRKLYEEIMPPNYYQHIKDIAHPEDIREVLICMAGKLGIDIIVKEEEKYGMKSYTIYIRWNSIPNLVGFIGDDRQTKVRAADWKRCNWVDSSMFMTYNELKQSDGSRPITSIYSSTAHSNSNINVTSGGNIATCLPIVATSLNNNDCSRAIIRDDALYVKIDGLTKLLYKCEGLGYNVDVLQCWINTTIEVSKFYCQLALEAHNEYNTNYTTQLKALHYREIEAMKDIPMPIISKGYLYIGTDPSHLTKCQYKLGMTTKPVNIRLSSSQTTNPEYYYIHSIETKEPNEAERILHTLLTKMGMKVSKEWYQLPSEEVAITLIDKVVEIVGCLYDDEYIDKFIQSIRALQLTT